MSFRPAHVTTLSLMAALSGCSDGTGPGDTPGGWSYRPDTRSLAAPVGVTLSTDFVSISGFGGSPTVVIDPASGREKYRLTSPGSGSAYRVGSVTAFTTPTGEIRVHDANDGRFLFAEALQVAPRGFLGSLGSVLIGVLGDSLLLGNDRDTGRELWRRQVAAIPCTRSCGAMFRIDAVGDEVLLGRVTDVSAALIHVTADGDVTVVPASRDAFRSVNGNVFASRRTVNAPLVIATSRALTSLNPTSGATNWQVIFGAIAPVGFYSQTTNKQFTADGSRLTIRMVDSAGVATMPVRDIVLMASDGSRVGERSLTVAESNDYLDAPCGATGRVRVLPDLTLEYTDVVTGARRASAAIPILVALREVPTVTGFIRGLGVTVDGRLVIWDPLTTRLAAVGCVV